MEKDYQLVIDKMFGYNYKHRTLRTVFDPYSTEWSDTKIDEKIAILKRILDSKEMTLNEIINSYKIYYLESLANKKHVVDAIEDSLIVLLDKLLKI
jgi:hypothetical protein